MLSYINATLKEAHPGHVIMDAMGFGFQVHIPASLYFELPPAGEVFTLYTHLQPRDDGFVLYGFRSSQERDFFHLLLGVAGIGPRAALSLLGHLSLSQVWKAITEEEISLLTGIPGIGNKSARRIVYELKEKLDAAETAPLAAAAGQAEAGGDSWKDVQEALLALGYSAKEVARARKALVSAGKGERGVEELFKKALDFLGKTP